MSNTTGSTRRSQFAHEEAKPSEAISNAAWVADEQTREAMIRLAAYSFYERRGYVAGSELQDWLEAEMEVDRQLTASQAAGHATQGVQEHLHPIAPVQTRARTPAKAAAKPVAPAPAKKPRAAASEGSSAASARKAGKANQAGKG